MKLMKILIFGTGKIAKKIMPGILFNNRKFGYEVVGVIDNDFQKHGADFYGFKICHPGEMNSFEYDKIIICVDSYYESIKSQLICGYKISENNIRDRWYLLQFILMNKYKDTCNLEIKTTLDYWRNGNKLSVFNDWIDEKYHSIHEVYWDNKYNMPYVLFTTIDDYQRKMYYPRNYPFILKHGHQYVADLLYEQSGESPHLYVQGKHIINDGDVIVDAGVCEGNFILKYINLLSKAYLFEMDPLWQEAISRTFSDEVDKVTVINRSISNRTGGSSIRIDDVIDRKIDFLKMDIEGAEIEGLLGAEKVLQESNAKCSICSYHRFGDELVIRNILGRYGYNTSTTQGYMVFTIDPDIFYHLDFRRGIVYGEK